MLAIGPLRQYQLTPKTLQLIEVALVTPRPPTGVKEDGLRDDRRSGSAVVART